MNLDQPLPNLIQKRISSRQYTGESIGQAQQQTLRETLHALNRGPLGSRVRLELIAATQQDRDSLRGLGTYGMIQSPPAFIVGAAQAGEKDLEDYGYLMEQAVLKATDLGLDTCWLGGSFGYSGFAQKVGLQANEILPAVTAVGMAVEKPSIIYNLMRSMVNAKKRFPWERIFFEQDFHHPLTPEMAGAYADVLEMVRLAPSASNKQPWRILHAGRQWHFVVQRDAQYARPNWVMSKMVRTDIQRLDMGIAMCHFEMTARLRGLSGSWKVSPQPALNLPDAVSSYVVSWVEA